MEPRYWVLRCKICHRLHRGDPVKESERLLNLGPASRKIACPDRPTQWASYSLDDWKQMSDREWNEVAEYPSDTPLSPENNS